MKKTRQGVRDLNDLPGPKPKKVTIPVQCEHKRFYTDDRGCHWYCPDCGLSWDVGAGC